MDHQIQPWWKVVDKKDGIQLPTGESGGSPKGSWASRLLLPLLILLCGLGGTGLATYFVQENIKVKNQQRFTEAADQILETIRSRMQGHIGLLRGGAGLFAAQEYVSAEEFRRFYDRLQITNHYAGVQGFGYTARVPASQLTEFTAMMRRQGLENFRIWPEDPRPEYHTIVFLEPPDERNRLALGYDMFTHPIRREAMERARDVGRAIASGKVRLVQEDVGGDTQNGFLIYLPVFAQGEVPPTVEGRRDKLQGFVYAPFRAGDLFTAMFGNSPPHGVHLRLYDGGEPLEDELLFATPGIETNQPMVTITHRLEVAGRIWTVVIEPSRRMGLFRGAERVILVPLLGLLATGLLLYFVQAEAKARGRLEHSTSQMRDQHEWLQVTLSSIGDAVITTDGNAQIRFMNPVAEKLTGWTKAQAEGKLLREVFDIVHEESRQVLECPSTRVLREGKVVTIPNHTLLIARDGTERNIDDTAAPILDATGQIRGVVLVFHEITQRRQYERRITAQHAVTSILAESPALESAAGRLLEGIAEHLRFDLGVFWLFDPAEKTGRAFQIWHLPNLPVEDFDQACLNFICQPGIGLPGRVWETGQAAWTRDFAHEESSGRGPLARKHGLRTAIVVPVGTDLEVFGALEFFSRDAHQPDLELRHVLSGLGAQIGQFIQRKRAEQALQESEALHRAISETAADGIVTIDEQSIILTANTAVERIFGYNRAELVGKSITMLMPERMRERHLAGIERFMATGQKRITWSGMELPGLTKEDVEIPLEISFGVTTRGGRYLFTGLIRDVTRRKQAEESLRQAEERFTLFVRHAEDHAIIFKDDEGRISHWNPGAERIFGFAGEEVVGQHAAMLFTPEDQENQVPRQQMERARKEGSAVDERWHVRKDGSRFFASGALIWLPGEHGRPGSYAKILRDITQRKRAEEAIQELNQELEMRVQRRTAALQESKEQMEAFTYTVAHDLRAPLRAMQGFSHALREDYAEQLDPSALDYLERIMSSAQRMDTLIQDLLAYSQLSRTDLPFQKVSVAEVLEAAIGNNAQLIESRGAKIERYLDSFSVHAHPATLQHVLSNLISNAIKFTPADQEPVIHVRAIEQSDRIKVSVQDNGIGIAPEHQTRIFRVFERLHAQEEYPGTGIGLAIVKTGIERMGGRVGLVSAPGEGSLFWIELARAE